MSKDSDCHMNVEGCFCRGGGGDYDCALTVNDYFLQRTAFEHKRTHTGNILLLKFVYFVTINTK